MLLSTVDKTSGSRASKTSKRGVGANPIGSPDKADWLLGDRLRYPWRRYIARWRNVGQDHVKPVCFEIVQQIAKRA